MLRKLVYSLGIVALVALGATSATFSYALAYTSPGTADGYVHDFANVISDETELLLETELQNVEASSTSEIAVAVIDTVGTDETIESYAVRLFEEWGVGQAKTDNGVLLVVAINDRKLRIEVGYGLEGALTDSIAQNIIDNDMKPYLKNADYDNAILIGVSKIQEAIAGEYVTSANTQSPSEDLSWLFELMVYALFIIPQWFIAVTARSKDIWAGGIFGALFGGLLWLILSLLSVISPMTGLVLTIVFTLLGFWLDDVISKSYKTHQENHETVPWWAGGGSGGSGGGFSSGGGSFGGGSSGGGGASGSW